jgi:hypothetical protein
MLRILFSLLHCYDYVKFFPYQEDVRRMFNFHGYEEFLADAHNMFQIGSEIR